MIISFEFDALTLAIIVAITISQSLFGVGILLWGTPIFLLTGENFIQTLTLLIPLSLMVSCLQIIPNLDKIDKKIFKRFLKYSLLGIFIGLNFIIIYSPDINLIVGAILCTSVGLKIKIISRFIYKVSAKFDNLFIFIIGLVHGLSNLGGPLLILRCALEKFDKESFRTLVAAVYLLFAIIQLIIITFQVGYIEISVIYLLIAAIIYFISNRYLFYKMDDLIFETSITFLMILAAVFLFAKHFDLLGKLEMLAP